MEFRLHRSIQTDRPGFTERKCIGINLHIWGVGTVGFGGSVDNGREQHKAIARQWERRWVTPVCEKKDRSVHACSREACACG